MKVGYCFLFLVCLLFTTQSLPGQCPGKDSLLARLSALKNADAPDPANELKELLSYESRIKGCTNDYDSLTASLLLRIGINYASISNYEKGIEYIINSINKAKSTRNKNCNELVVKGYLRLQAQYDSLSLPYRRKEALDSGIAVSLRTNAGYNYSCYLMTQRAEYYFFKGEYQRCINDASLGENLVRRYYHNNDSILYLLFFITYRADALFYLDATEKADQFINTKLNEYKKSLTPGDLGVLYNNLGMIFSDKGDYKKASHYFKESYRCNIVTGFKEGAAQALKYNGLLEFKRNKDTSAMRFYNRAIPYASRIELISIFSSIANVFARYGKFDSAFFYFQKSFNQIKNGIDEAALLNPGQDYIGLGMTEYVVSLVLDKAEASLNRYIAVRNSKNLADAMEIYKTADKILDKVKADQRELKSKLFWQSYERRLYENAIKLCYLAGRKEEAFYFFEKSRAVLLVEQLSEQKGMKQEDLLKRALLKKKLITLEKTLAAISSSSSEHIRLQNEFSLTQQQYDNEKQTQQNPAYASLFSGSGFITPEEVQKKILEDRKVFFGIYNGDSAVYTILITSATIYLEQIPKVEFDRLISRYNSYLSNSVSLNKQYNDYIKTARDLYQLIFTNKKITETHIIISPDGEYFPFESLVVSKPSEPIKYFLQDHATSYTYSARFLLSEFYSDSTSSPKKFLGVAPVNYPASFSLVSLHGSEKSLEIISGYFSNISNLISNKATRSNFLSQFSQYQIIQFYTHAADSSKNNEPVIYFSDSLLYLSELIGETKPATKLIVLSACETGLGIEYKGEGVFSFNRGFAALGIPSSVTNLWTVDNESTYKITELFYKYVADGLPLDEALQQAKLDFIKTSSKEKQLPYYWAASVLVGRTDAIPAQKNRNWLLYGSIACVPVLLSILFIAIRKRRSIPVPDTTETAA